MLKPEIGSLVLWYPYGQRTNQPLPAIVTSVGLSGLLLNIFMQNSYNMACREGVRHIDDPELAKYDDKEAGAWDWSANTKELYDLRQGMRDMVASARQREPDEQQRDREAQAARAARK